MKVMSRLLLCAVLALLMPAAWSAGGEPALDAAPVVNINQADASELSEALNGVGEKKAAAIVEYRRKHGDFGSAAALSEVKGIGPATVDKNRERIQLD